MKKIMILTKKKITNEDFNETFDKISCINI